MKLNLKRSNMALRHAKRTTNYLLKLKSNNRLLQHKVVKATNLLFEIEKILRDTQYELTKGDKK